LTRSIVMILRSFLFLFISCFIPSEQQVKQVLVPGEIILGGLFPIHAAGKNGSHCGTLKADQGVQRMVAMLFTLEEINKKRRENHETTLGAQILDTCSVDGYALEQTLEFVKTRLNDANCVQASRQPVAAVIGAASSQVSVMVASMLQLFKVSMISYSSTGSELSEKARFHLFSRVVPPDNLQATVMAKVVKKLEWNYVHAIADSGSYGEKGMEAFRVAAAREKVCIDGDVHKIGRRPTTKEFESIITRMKSKGKARGVVMFVDEDNLKQLLSVLEMMIDRGNNDLKDHFWFVASDSWGKKTSVVSGRERLTLGAITIAPKQRTIDGFNDYFLNLGPTNPFLEEYWDSLNCGMYGSTNFGECFSSTNLTFNQESYVPYVYDAVSAMAHAISKYIKRECGDTPYGSCELQSQTFNGEILQTYYRNKTIGEARIDEKGDGMGLYDVFQIGKQGLYMKIGTYERNDLSLNLSETRSRLVNTNNFPFSVCSQNCAAGFYRSYQDQTCCWACIPCDNTTSIVVNVTECMQCPLGEVPDRTLSFCQRIPPDFITFSSLWSILPSAFAAIGIFSTLFVLAVFLKFSSTPVIMASGRELCYCMLTGISLCYVLTFCLLTKPTIPTCAAQRLLIGLCMSAIYAAIIVKTNRLARVFSPSSAQRPRFITPKAQVAITGVIVSVQLVGSLLWLVISPPGTTIIFPTRIEAVLTCNATASHLMVSLSYNMVLILACTVYAFKTRKIPENFNETRLIGFTMYSTSILWLAFVPIYFATQNNFFIQMTSLAMCISMSGTVALMCFFGPKVYIVLFQPEKNVRTRQSAVGRLVNQQMRFISQITTHAENTATLCTSAPPSLNPSYKPDSEESSATGRNNNNNNTDRLSASQLPGGKKLSWNEVAPKDRGGSLRKLRKSLKLRSKSVKETRSTEKERREKVEEIRKEEERKKETAESEPLTKNKEKEKEMSSLNETTEEVSTTPIQSQIELILDEIISGNPKATFL
ncbi:mgl-3, partial [Pristionchus pacificus]